MKLYWGSGHVGGGGGKGQGLGKKGEEERGMNRQWQLDFLDDQQHILSLREEEHLTLVPSGSKKAGLKRLPN